MMQPVAIPPFERFYEEHRSEVLPSPARKLGAERAEDAFQETFLRALQAYRRLEHGEHLRAWILTIARTWRWTRPPHEAVAELDETGVEDSRPAYESLLQ